MLFSIALLIYNFLIYYIPSTNLKNFGILRLHRDSRKLSFYYLLYYIHEPKNFELI